MNELDRKAYADEFRRKNARRQDGRDTADRRVRKDAKALRKLTDGKFGNMAPSAWNLRIAGTLGVPRSGGGD